MSKKLLAAVSALCLCAVQAAIAQSVSERDGRLADGGGRSLYTFDKDAPGQSRCHEACAANWPPFMAGEGAQPKGDYSLVARDDGERQWAHKGKPLYYFVGDTQPGDAKGEGSGGVWHVARVRSETARSPFPVFGNPDY